MKTLNKITTGALAVMAVLFLDACSKTKNSTPTVSNNAAVCSAQGFYTAPNGQNMGCQPGMPINNGYNNGVNGAYPAGTQACVDATNYYRVQYVPVMNQYGTYDCYRFDVLRQYAQGSQYYDDYSSWYEEPPHSSQYSNGGSFWSGINLFVTIPL